MNCHMPAAPTRLYGARVVVALGDRQIAEAAGQAPLLQRGIHHASVAAHAFEREPEIGTVVVQPVVEPLAEVVREFVVRGCGRARDGICGNGLRFGLRRLLCLRRLSRLEGPVRERAMAPPGACSSVSVTGAASASAGDPGSEGAAGISTGARLGARKQPDEAPRGPGDEKKMRASSHFSVP